MPKRNPVVRPLKLGDDVLVFFDKDHGTPGKLRRNNAEVLFTAHDLPQRHLDSNRTMPKCGVEE